MDKCKEDPVITHPSRIKTMALKPNTLAVRKAPTQQSFNFWNTHAF